MTNTTHTWTETTERRYNEALNCIPPFKQFSDCFFIGEMTEGTTTGFFARVKNAFYTCTADIFASVDGLMEELEIAIECDEVEIPDEIYEYNELNDTQKIIYNFYREHQYDDHDSAIYQANNAVVYYGCYDMRQVAEEVATQCGYLDEMPEHLRCYFDFDAFGRDLEIEGTFDYCQELSSYIEFMN